MKTKIVILASLLLIATAGYFSSNSERAELSDLLLMNVEALAGDESEQLVACIGTGSVDCPYLKDKVKYLCKVCYSLEVPY